MTPAERPHALRGRSGRDGRAGQFSGQRGGVWHHCRREASGSPAGRRQPSRERRSSADPGRRHGAREVDRSQSVGPDARCSSPSGAPRPLIPLVAVRCRAADVGPRAFHRPEARVGFGPRAELPVLARRGGVRHSEPGRDPILRRFAHYSPGHRECYEAQLKLDFPPGALAWRCRALQEAVLFQNVDPAGWRLTGRALERRVVLAMIKRRAAAAGLPPSTCCHTFRATGITAYLSNGGTLERQLQVSGDARLDDVQLRRRFGGGDVVVTVRRSKTNQSNIRRLQAASRRRARRNWARCGGPRSRRRPSETAAGQSSPTVFASRRRAGTRGYLVG